MNSEVQVLVKLEYVHATCGQLIAHLSSCENMLPTVYWLQNEVATVYNRIVSTADPKKRMSWTRSVVKAAQHLRTLVDTDQPLAFREDVAEEEGVLLLLSVITQMIEDISLVPSKKDMVEHILTAAYTLEALIKLPKSALYEEDEIREHASIFLDGIYGKLNEMH